MSYTAAQTCAAGRTKPSDAAAPPRSAWTPTSCGRTGWAGRPAEVAARIAEFAETGARTVYLQILDLADLDHLELIAAEVAPQV